jgi:hypothetical protein
MRLSRAPVARERRSVFHGSGTSDWHAQGFNAPIALHAIRNRTSLASQWWRTAFRRVPDGERQSTRPAPASDQDNADVVLLLGAEARQRVVTHTEDFPLMALTSALARLLQGNLTHRAGGPHWVGGRSLGFEDQHRTRVQPTGTLIGNGNWTSFTLVWERFRLSLRFDARISAGLRPRGCVI